jgi:hypothetical protein
MKNKIIETDWENVIDAEIDINSACSNFTKTFLNIAKTCIPTREVTIRSDACELFSNTFGYLLF